MGGNSIGYSDRNGLFALALALPIDYLLGSAAIISGGYLIHDTSINDFLSFSKSASALLAENIALLRGHERECDQDAHHIVARTASKAEPARKVLERVNIDINSGWNGVNLPRGYHATLHRDAYYDYVNYELRELETSEQVKGKLTEIRGELLRGKTFPLAGKK